MRHTRTAAPLVTLLAAVVSAVALPARGEADPAEVETLFKQLAADDFRDRDAARKGLIDLGDEAVPHIKALAAKANDPETRAAVEAVLQGIDARSVSGPSLITLDVTDAPAEEVLRAIAKQAHAELPVWPEGAFQRGPLKDRKVTLKVKRQPFWNVMKDLLPELGLHVASHGRGNQMTLSQGGGESMKGPAHIDGPFMVVANSAHESNTINFANPGQRSSSVSIALQAYVEPKLKVIGRAHTPVIEEFTDDAGQSLVDEAQRRAAMLQMRIQTHARESSFSLRVPVPAGRAKRVGLLKGFVPILAQTKTDRIEVPDIAKAKGSVYTKGGWRLEVQDLAENDGQYTLKMEITRDVPIRRQPGPPPRNEWRDRLDGDAIRLLDADGRPLEKSGYSMNGQNHIYKCEMRFRRKDTPAGPPAKLVWVFPTEAEELRIPFEFKDLPLP